MGWVIMVSAKYFQKKKKRLLRVFSNVVHMLRASTFIDVVAHVSLFSGAEEEH